MATGRLAEEAEDQAFWAPAPAQHPVLKAVAASYITVNQVSVSNPYQVLISEGQPDKACPG